MFSDRSTTVQRRSAPLNHRTTALRALQPRPPAPSLQLPRLQTHRHVRLRTPSRRQLRRHHLRLAQRAGQSIQSFGCRDHSQAGRTREMQRTTPFRSRSRPPRLDWARPQAGFRRRRLRQGGSTLRQVHGGWPVSNRLFPRAQSSKSASNGAPPPRR